MEHLAVYYLGQVSQTHGPMMLFMQSSHWIVPTELRLLWFKIPGPESSEGLKMCSIMAPEGSKRFVVPGWQYTKYARKDNSEIAF